MGTCVNHGAAAPSLGSRFWSREGERGGRSSRTDPGWQVAEVEGRTGGEAARDRSGRNSGSGGRLHGRSPACGGASEPGSSTPLLRTSITAHDCFLDIRPNVALVSRPCTRRAPAMSNDTQKADQIAHRLYVKLALVVNHARATLEPSPDAKVDKWVGTIVCAPRVFSGS